jgi:hypothetical protein
VGFWVALFSDLYVMTRPLELLQILVVVYLKNGLHSGLHPNFWHQAGSFKFAKSLSDLLADTHSGRPTSTPQDKDLSPSPKAIPRQCFPRNWIGPLSSSSRSLRELCLTNGTSIAPGSSYTAQEIFTLQACPQSSTFLRRYQSAPRCHRTPQMYLSHVRVRTHVIHVSSSLLFSNVTFIRMGVA